MHLINTASLRVLVAMALATLSVHSYKRTRSLVGLCNKIDTLKLQASHGHNVNRLDRRQLNLIPTTKVHWRPDEGQIVIKYKMDLKILCEKFEMIMGNVKKDLRNMLFYRTKRNRAPQLS